MSRGDQQIRRLLQELERPATRQRAIEALAALGEPVVGPLARVMSDSDVNTSQAAARALTQIGAPAVDTLCVLLSDEDWSVSQSAASALARIGAPAVEPLCRKLGDPNARTSHLATTALAKIRKPAVEALCRSLSNPDPGVRVHAARALVTAGTVAVPPLTRAFRRPEIYLEVSRGDRAFTLEQESRWLRKSAAGVLAQIGGSALDVLCSELGSDEDELCRAAAEALEACGEPAVEPLCRQLDFDQDRRHNHRVALHSGTVPAARVLGRIGHLGALDALVQALDHPNSRVRIAAAYGLGDLATATPAPELRALLPGLNLRRVRYNLSAPRSDEAQAVQHAIRTIEAATAQLAAVPLPAAGLALKKNTLPRPAGLAVSEADSFPIATDAGEPAEAVERAGWWSRLTHLFR